MKKVLLIALAIFMTLGVSSAWARCSKNDIHAGLCSDYGDSAPTASQRSQRQTPQREVASLTDHNAHVIKYLPSDLTTKMYVTKQCTADGVITQEYQNFACRDFTSRSAGTTWRVAFGANGNAQAVFQVANGNPVPWVEFKAGTQQAIYESSGAQQYAMAHGGGSQPAMAQENPRQPAPAANSSGPCAGLSGAARTMCDNASRSLPALGGLFGK